MEFNITFIISIISFIIFTALMNKILYKPLEEIVQKRENLISGNFSDAENANTEAKSLLDTKAEKLAKAKIDAKKITADKLQEANNEADEHIKNAKNKYSEYINSEKDNLSIQYNKIKQDMKDSTIDIAQIISDKLLKEKFPIRRSFNE